MQALPYARKSVLVALLFALKNFILGPKHIFNTLVENDEFIK